MPECRKCNLFHHVHSCLFLALLQDEKVYKRPVRVHIQSHHVDMRSRIQRNQCKVPYRLLLRRVLSIGKSIVAVSGLTFIERNSLLSGVRLKHSLFDLKTTCVLRPWQESNLRTRLRKPMLYPLSYRGELQKEGYVLFLLDTSINDISLYCFSKGYAKKGKELFLLED